MSENTDNNLDGEKEAAPVSSIVNLDGDTQVRKVSVKEFTDKVHAGDDALNKLRIQNLDFILDIPLKVTVELGRTSLAIKDLLQLGQGSVLELDKLAGEPLEILVNGKLIAKGEVVVVNEKFGIRLTDIISPIERIETLR